MMKVGFFFRHKTLGWLEAKQIIIKKNMRMITIVCILRSNPSGSKLKLRTMTTLMVLMMTLMMTVVMMVMMMMKILDFRTTAAHKHSSGPKPKGENQAVA